MEPLEPGGIVEGREAALQHVAAQIGNACSTLEALAAEIGGMLTSAKQPWAYEGDMWFREERVDTVELNEEWKENE